MTVAKPLTVDYIAMVCIVVLLLKAMRRTLGNILFFFIIFSWVSPFLPAGVFRAVATAKNKTFTEMFEKIHRRHDDGGIRRIRHATDDLFVLPCSTSSSLARSSLNAAAANCSSTWA